jgi:hypothetical protein
MDSQDWKIRDPHKLFLNVLSELDRAHHGIILFHDIHEQTVKALPTVLKELKSHGFKVVHLVPKSHVEVITQAEPPKAEASHGGTHHRAHYVKRRRYAKR